MVRLHWAQLIVAGLAQAVGTWLIRGASTRLSPFGAQHQPAPATLLVVGEAFRITVYPFTEHSCEASIFIPISLMRKSKFSNKKSLRRELRCSPCKDRVLLNHQILCSITVIKHLHYARALPELSVPPNNQSVISLFYRWGS